MSQSAIFDLLRSCGLVLGAGESPLEVLRRHARHRLWRPATLRKWERLLLPLLQVVAESAFDSLTSMNKWLIGLGLPPATSKSEAHKLLRGVYINIYDLLAERYDRKCSSLAALRKYTHQHRLYYPLAQAKNEGLRVFLRKLF